MFRKILCPVAIAALAIIVSSCSPSENSLAPTQSNEPVGNIKNSPSAQSESQAESFEINLDEQGLALRGYDPVAYFTDGKAVEGKKEFNSSWNNVGWHFVNEENRDKFEQDPEKYAPANGGYCTFGVVLGKKFDGDPQVWSMLKDRLYVFLNEEVKEKFLQDTTGNLEKIGKNWPKIKSKAPEDLE